MKFKSRSLLAICLAALVATPLVGQEQTKQKEEPSKKTKKEKDEKKKSPIEGQWKVTSGKRMGVESEAERLPPSITVKGDQLTIPTPGSEPFVMSFKYDKSKKPIEVDFKIESGPAPEGTALGILKVEKNKATLCYSFTGADRPTKFESTEDNQCHLFVMEKVAEKLTAEALVGKWKITKGTRAGEAVAAERLAGEIKFEKDKIVMPAGADEFVMSYKIDNSKSPAQVDMKVMSGPAPEGSPAVGIIKMADGKLTLCYDGMGGSRPEKFESTADDQYFLFVLEKE